VLASIAGVLVGWREVKQFGQLAHAYSLAANELGLIEAQATHVATDDEFAAFVADAEQAISREHTMWAARRRAGA
jgi:SMODS and SLOG-associating 2TM effector domain 1